MRERRLLERIAAWEAGGQRTNQTRVDILVRSVIDHLVRLLNTRQGSVLTDPKFGVPDFTNLAATSVKGSTRDIEEEIRRMVLKYEPRIRSPRITLNRAEADVLSMRFELEGALEVDDAEISLRLETTVGANGKVSVM